MFVALVDVKRPPCAKCQGLTARKTESPNLMHPATRRATSSFSGSTRVGSSLGPRVTYKTAGDVQRLRKHEGLVNCIHVPLSPSLLHPAPTLPDRVPPFAPCALFRVQIDFMREMGTVQRMCVASTGGTVMVARSPATAIAVLKEVEGRGPFCSLTLSVVVMKDVLVIVLFALNLSAVKFAQKASLHASMFVKGPGIRPCSEHAKRLFRINLHSSTGYSSGDHKMHSYWIMQRTCGPENTCATVEFSVRLS